MVFSEIQYILCDGTVRSLTIHCHAFRENMPFPSLQKVEEEAVPHTMEVLGCDVGELTTEMVTMIRTYQVDNTILKDVIDPEKFSSVLPLKISFKARSDNVVELTPFQ